jgi:soluble lytic murein transglycosylase
MRRAGQRLGIDHRDPVRIRSPFLKHSIQRQLLLLGLAFACSLGLVVDAHSSTERTPDPPDVAGSDPLRPSGDAESSDSDPILDALPTLPGLPAPPADRILRARSEAIFDDPAALLRAAAEGIEQNDDAHADWLYAQLAKRHPIVGDHAGFRRARLQLSKGRAVEARQIASKTVADYPNSPLRAELFELIGESLIAERDEPGAREAWAAALAETTDDDQRATLLRRVARSEERSGEDHAAGITWRLVWYAHPASHEAAQASHRLDLIEAHLGETLRRASDWRRRGDRLFRLRMNEEALDAYDHALAMGLSKSEAGPTRKQRARTFFRLRRYPEASQAFEELDQAGDTPIWLARSMARADRVPEAIEAFEQLASRPGPQRARAHYLAALLLDGRDRNDEARAHFRVLAEDARQDGLSRASLWYLGWSDYRAGQLGSAARQFAALAAATEDEIDRLRPLYWQARALESDGKSNAATEIFAQLAEDFPLSYYGWRARDRSVSLDRKSPLHEIAQGRSGLRPSELDRVRILMAAGLVDSGVEESAQLIRNARGLDDRVALARLLTSAGDFNRAQRVIVDAYTTSLARGPVAGLEELWWYAWPSAFSGHVDAATRSDGSVDPELVYSIMREESGYRPKVVSPVGARGLLQIMRETGKQLAGRVGRANFAADDLFDPAMNIELGSFYLGELSRQFPTRVSASIASYNAGPHVVARWVDGDPSPDDEWVESIPYSQTRSYVKRVLRSLQAYRLLY